MPRRPPSAMSWLVRLGSQKGWIVKVGRAMRLATAVTAIGAASWPVAAHADTDVGPVVRRPHS